MVLTVDDVPAPVRGLVEEFHEGLRAALGDDFAGLFLYGSVAFQPSPLIDLDFHALVRRPLEDGERRTLAALHDRLDTAYPPVEELDGYYVTVDAARSAERPRTELRPEKRDGMWAIHRAHIHAGRYIVVSGPDPRDLCPVPAWSELAEELAGEIDELAERVGERPGAYAVLNACRVHRSFSARDVVLSKMDAARWAFGSVDPRWHALIRAAIRDYLRAPEPDDAEIFDRDARDFFAMMRDRITAERTVPA